MKKAKRRAARRGTLFLISLLMVGSAGIRVALEAGPALARQIDAERAPQDDRGSSAAPPDEASLQKLLMNLQTREKALQEREVKLTDQAQAQEIAKKAIEKKLLDLAEAEESLKATLALADVAAEGDLARLTSVYEQMKAKDAAGLFEEMDPTFAAGFLARMKPEAAAGVMAGLSPKAAYTVSVVLAGRNALVPTE